MSNELVYVCNLTPLFRLNAYRPGVVWIDCDDKVYRAFPHDAYGPAEESERHMALMKWRKEADGTMVYDWNVNNERLYFMPNKWGYLRPLTSSPRAC